MKINYLKYISIILIYTSSISCIDSKKIKSDLEKDGLIGKVKSITENTFKVNEKFGEIIKGEKLVDIFNKENHSKIYNEKGFIIEEINQPVFFRVLNKYNGNKLIETRRYSESGILSSIISIIYDENGNEIETNQYIKDKLVNKCKFINDHNGNATEVNNYDYAGALNSKSKNVYKENNLIESKHYNSNGNIEFISEFIYDKNGNILEEKNYNSANDITYHKKSIYNNNDLLIEYKDILNNSTEKYVYKFDQLGNWIQKTVYLNNKSDNLIERTINYY